MEEYALALLVTVAVGLVAWVSSTMAVVGKLLGRGACVAAYSFSLFRYYGLPLLTLVAALVGHRLPTCFFLWCVALISLRPIAGA